MNNSFLRRSRAACVVAAAFVLANPASANDADVEARLAAALSRLDAQAAEIERQRQELIALRAEVTGLVQEADIREAVSDTAPTPDADQSQATAQQDDPTDALLASFPNAFPIPDTDAALRIGGYVKASVAQNFDPLTVPDQFIVGSIPVSATQSESARQQAGITVAQSRLSLDLREATDVGLLRAFTEGDFAGSGDTFRLRHAFGQWRRALAGKTWSTFVDPGASPEELDFEGLNGRINVRQAQFRVTPRIGETLQLQLSLEDPNPAVTGGSGVSQIPDLIGAIRIDPRPNVHYRLAMLLRQVRATPDTSPNNEAQATGWGVSLSGLIEAPIWDERDKLMFQINAGTGMGRYVNDLNSVGAFDGVFSRDGDLELLDVLATYVSGQHWWRSDLRSNMTLGYVQVDSPGFVADDFYDSTLRASANLIWTPIPRVDVGAELLWGKRENADGETGTATQLQVATKFLF